MNLTVWNPFREMEELLDRYSRSARNTMAVGESGVVEAGDWMPRVDITETDSELVVKAELPGVEKDKIKVSIDNGMLTIRGEKRSEIKDEKRHRIECASGSFVRSFALPQYIDAEKVEAAHRNGTLILTIPKLDKAKPKQIEVNAG